MRMTGNAHRGGSWIAGAVGAHPGFANTNACRGSAPFTPTTSFRRWFSEQVVEPLVPKAPAAAGSIIHAASAEGMCGGDYFGPKGIGSTPRRVSGCYSISSAA